MSVRYQRRINLGGGLGLNLSKSGVSMSKRTPFGSIGTSGYSVKSGIPGLFFRKYTGKKSKKSTGTFSGKDLALIVFMVMAISAFVYFVFHFFKALFLLTAHYSIMFYFWLRQKIATIKGKSDLKKFGDNKDIIFVKFNYSSLPESWKNTKIVLTERLAKNGQLLAKHDEIGIVNNGEGSASILAERTGRVYFYLYPGSTMKNDALIYRIE